MSRAAVQAALFIIVYRDRPVLQLPFRLLAALMNVDELLTLWRYRHALMVQRMIGVKIGTGGSAGHDYLRDTAAKHRIFSDLFRLSTYLIPRSRLPKLPRELEDAMGYRYTAGPNRDDARPARIISPKFRGADPGRIHLAAHSHHFWPDAACAAHRRRWPMPHGSPTTNGSRSSGADAARAAGIAAILALPDPATIAFAPNTHDFVRRLLSALPPGARRAFSPATANSIPSRARSPASKKTGWSRSSASPPSRSRAFPSASRRGARGGHDLVFVSQVFFNSAQRAATRGRYRRRGCRPADARGS